MWEIWPVSNKSNKKTMNYRLFSQISRFDRKNMDKINILLKIAISLKWTSASKVCSGGKAEL